MEENDSTNLLTRLKKVLREASLLLSFQKDDKKAEWDECFNKACQILFDNDFYQNLWDESVLLQLDKLFQVKRPSEKVYGQQLKVTAEHTITVKQINDLLFLALVNEVSPEQIYNRLIMLAHVDEAALSKIKALNRLQEIRSSKYSASEKLDALVEHLINDIGVNFGERERDIRQVITSIRGQESPGRINALLISTKTNVGTLIPISIHLRVGSGKIHCLIRGSEDFKSAIDRAQSAMVSGNYLNEADDVTYSLDVTEAEYSGNSIGLAAAIGMYSAYARQAIDPYTAFTGNINLEGSQYKITFVEGIKAKLDAALLFGCRRVFVPKENRREVGEEYNTKLKIIYVTDIAEVLLKLQSSLEPLIGDSRQVRKINFLKGYCQGRGWDLCSPEAIQDGLQFTASPPHPPELKVTIFDSGAHSPKTHPAAEFQELLEKLGDFDKSKVPIQKVEQTFSIKDAELRRQIREKLDGLKPVETRKEQYCDFSYRFEDKKEKIVIKQFTNGKLQLQGSGGELYKKILDVVITLYNLKYPNARLSLDDYIRYEAEENSTSKKGSLKAPHQANIPLPHIGTDESGKGDYFGPMVIAGIWLDEPTKAKLEAMGIKDSKLLSDKRCRELAARIRTTCNEKFVEVELPPERYNELYEEFKKEGKNLNHLLAWGHARAIESLLEKNSCTHAVADQFGDEKLILSKLMEKGKRLELIQTPKGERYIAVAGASILARDRFLSRMDKLGQEYSITLPKGASDAVIHPARQIIEKRGSAELKKVAKLHHKTTQRIIEQGR
ncbi:MAG: ribonuclease HIII [Methanotrichaceae archaeon]|nr:ribonuclease HIII [Methanotrichaceae archaeon]